MPLAATVHRTLESVSALSGEWAALHASSGSRLPFNGPEFALTWLQHFTGPDDVPVVFEVRDGPRLVGMAPYYQHRMRGGLSRLQPVGTGLEWIGPYEVPAMLAEAGRGREVARAVVQEMCREPVAWDWVNVALGEAAPWFEPEWLPDPDFTFLVKHLVGAVVLDLTGGPVEELLFGRRNVKESIRRAKNRLNSAYGSEGWSVARVTGPAEVSEALTRLVRLHESRSKAQTHREHHVNVFESPAVLTYLRDVVGQLAERRMVSIYELRAGEERLASQLIWHTQTASYSSVSGISEAGWPFSPVTYLQWSAIQDAHAAGHREMNLSIGPNQAKLRWTNEVRYFPDFVVVGPRRRSKGAYPGAHLWSALSAYREAVRTRERPDGHRQPPAAPSGEK